MNNTSIYHEVGLMLYEKRFFLAKNDEKYEILKETLFEYTITKIADWGLNIDISKYDSNNLEVLLMDLNEIINNNNFFDDYVYYILSIVEVLQDKKIDWKKTNNVTVPTITIDDYSNWTTLESNPKNPSVGIVFVTLHTFKSLISNSPEPLNQYILTKK